MNKFAALLMLFLGASFMLQATQAQDCVVAYYDIPAPPECEYITDENGEEEEECTSVGSAAFASALNADSPVLSEPTFPLSEADFTGDCDCTLTVYSKTGLTGCKITREVGDGDGVEVVPGIWKGKANPKSFEVVCSFPQ